MQKRLIFASLLVALLIVPAVAHAGAADDRAATRSAVRATMTFTAELRAAAPRAGAAAQVIRTRGRACLEDFAAVPVARAEVAYGFYFLSLSSGLWFADAPVYSAWIERGLAPAARRSGVWRRERDRLLQGLVRARQAYGLGRADPCPVIRAWRAEGFSPDRAPEPIPELVRQLAQWDDEPPAWPSRAVARLLKRYGGQAGRRVGVVLENGVDEPDNRVERNGDPIAELFERI